MTSIWAHFKELCLFFKMSPSWAQLLNPFRRYELKKESYIYDNATITTTSKMMGGGGSHEQSLLDRHQILWLSSVMELVTFLPWGRPNSNLSILSIPLVPRGGFDPGTMWSCSRGFPRCATESCPREVFANVEVKGKRICLQPCLGYMFQGTVCKGCHWCGPVIPTCPPDCDSPCMMCPR